MAETPAKEALSRTCKRAASPDASEMAKKIKTDVAKKIKSLPSCHLYRGVGLPKTWFTRHDSGVLVSTAEGAAAEMGEAQVAAFDFDGCLARTSLGGTADDWKPLNERVIPKLRLLHDEGYRLVIFTNESMDRLKSHTAIMKAIKRKTGRLDQFRAKANVPIDIFCACKKNEFRKPDDGMWALMCETLSFKVDMAKSFYVGDAAGRKGDHSDADKSFAARVGVPFHTETDYWV